MFFQLLSSKCSTFLTPEKIRKSEVFWWFEVVRKGNNCLKWIKKCIVKKYLKKNHDWYSISSIGCIFVKHAFWIRCESGINVYFKNSCKIRYTFSWGSYVEAMSFSGLYHSYITSRNINFKTLKENCPPTKYSNKR